MAPLSQSPAPRSSIEWTGRAVTLMGLGRHGGGVGAARYLAGRGAHVTISDLADAGALAESLAQLADVPIAALSLGAHREADFREAELVIVSPAVPPTHPCLQVARNSGAELTSEIEIFLRGCPAQIIGVTGSNGKSTTCAMLADILRAAGRRTWLGGNFGGSLLGDMEQMTVDDCVVLELSSFQLDHLSDDAPLPRIAVVTNCSPNHLDWHGSYAAYRRAKQRLVTGQPADGIAILNPHDAEASSWACLAAGRVADSWPLERVPPLAVPGAHNRQNAALAAAAATVTGVEEADIYAALAAFRGLDHRLQCVAEAEGRRFYNDSKSTTPEATLAALVACEGPMWLLAGGHAKGADFQALAAAIVERAQGAAVYGAARDALAACIMARDSDFKLRVVDDLPGAVAWCWRQSQAGDAILLSPACASYDQFRDFTERGETFIHLARALETRAAETLRAI